MEEVDYYAAKAVTTYHESVGESIKLKVRDLVYQPQDNTAFYGIGVFAMATGIWAFRKTYWPSVEFQPSYAACLQYAVSKRTGTNTWINLGYWKDDDISFPQAGEELAMLLGEAMKLDRNDHIIDVGSGKGDQLLLWLQAFNVKKIFALDVCKSHVACAQNVVKRHLSEDMLDKVQIKQLCGTCLPYIEHANTLICLDAMCHIPRAKFFRNVQDSIQKVGMVDLVVSSSFKDYLAKHFWYRCFARFVCWMGCIPYENVITESEYKQLIQDAGFPSVHIQQIDKPVLHGFVQFVKNQDDVFRLHQTHARTTEGFRKHRRAAWLFEKLLQWDAIHMLLLTATRT